MNKARASVVLTLFLCTGALAGLAERIESILATEQNATLTLRVLKAESGEVVYSHQATEPMIPASNMKLIITAACVRRLGPDFEYVTRVGISDETLVVIGSGDPLLGDPKMDAKYERERDWIFVEIAKSLKALGVTVINDVIVDSTVFDNERVHPNWPLDQLNRWYACEVSGLNFNDNCIDVQTENVDGAVTVSVEPATSFVHIINEVTPITSGDSAIGAYRNTQSNTITVRGKCKSGSKVGPIDVAIENPAAFFGFLLAENFARHGIAAKGKLIEGAFDEKEGVRPVAEFRTTLADCLVRANKDSLGLVAEALLKTLAAHSSEDGKNGSWVAGRTVISRYLLDLGVDNEQFYIDDGSGLSRKNLLSATAVCAVLLDMYKSGSWTLFRDSLAVGGLDGTITNYFLKSRYKGKVFGKTGTIRGVRAFSGACMTDNGEYLFSILANKADGRARARMYDIVEAIIDEYSTSG